MIALKIMPESFSRIRTPGILTKTLVTRHNLPEPTGHHPQNEPFAVLGSPYLHAGQSCFHKASWESFSGRHPGFRYNNYVMLAVLPLP